MAEILKITTPYINNNRTGGAEHIKPAAEPSAPFALQDVQTVTRPATQQEILQQGSGLIEGGDSAGILATLLKDPAGTVNFIKNIMVLQELVKLLPANNTTVTQEIEQMFTTLLINPEDIAEEMKNQEMTSTVFKGELFNLLRQALSRNPSEDMQNAVANLLKSINNLQNQQNTLHAVANSLKFLSESLSPSKALSEKLAQLARQFRCETAPEQFAELKKEAMALLKEVEGNLLFSPKMAKISAMTLYNLSRFNDNPDFFQDSVSNLYLQLGANQRKEFLQVIHRFRNGQHEGAEDADSKIMDVLTKIIAEQSSKGVELSASVAEKIEKIIYSLLSSPCHFTPLLHFIVPVEYGLFKSFAEVWINPNGGEDRRDDQEAEECIHVLIAFDIEGMGQFEAELYVLDQRMEFSLFCPPLYSEAFAKQADRFAACVKNSVYKLDKLRIDPLEKQRSLMEVFKSLPYKRAGVNVKV